MFRKKLERSLQRREDEVWASAEAAWPTPLVRVNWLHALSEYPTEQEGWISKRGILLLSQSHLHFDDSDGRPGVLPLARMLKLEWIDGHERAFILWAHPDDESIMLQQGYDFELPGQQGANSRLLKARFAEDLERTWRAIPEPTHEELWPPDGSPGVAVYQRRTSQ